MKEIDEIQPYIPAFLNKRDGNGISLSQQAQFTHNMVSIIDCFESIEIQALSKLLDLKVK